MSDASVSVERAREAIRAGKLPSRRPDRMWGGPGLGASCAICGSPLLRGELEFELEFARNGAGSGDRHHVHLACFQAWESEIEKLEPTGEAAGTPP